MKNKCKKLGSIFILLAIQACNSNSQNGAIIPPTLGSPYNVKLAPYSAKADGATDDSTAFQKAIDDASAALTKNFDHGPTGEPQNVVTVPSGTYRIKNILLKNNVRFEAYAGAVFLQAGGADYGKSDLDSSYETQKISMFILDAPTPTTSIPDRKSLTNVTLIGVDTSSDGKPTAEPGWEIRGSFTINVDTAKDSNPDITPISLVYVDGALLQNFITIKNNTSPDSGLDGKPDHNNYHPAVLFKSSQTSPLNGPYYDPHNITYRNHYSLGSVLGGGANQIQSAHDLTIENIFSEGGIALRVETDNRGDAIMKAVKAEQPSCCVGVGSCDGDPVATPCTDPDDLAMCICTGDAPCDAYDVSLPGNYGSEVKGIVANHIEAKNGSAAVSLLPHEQNNSDVTVTDIIAENCDAGVVVSGGSSLGMLPGSFSDVHLSQATIIGGSGAQIPQKNVCAPAWTIDDSEKILSFIREPEWSFDMSSCSFSGTFIGSPQSDYTCN